MPTIQVNAQTSQAVGAFNALANAIAAANGQIGSLNVSIRTGAASNNAYAASSSAIGGAFERLIVTANNLFEVMTKVGGAMEFVFTSILGELDKIQGFNAMMSVTTKNSTEAASAYDFLRKTADQLGVQFDALLKNYAQLLAAMPDVANKTQIVQTTFLGLANAARTLHASNTDTQLMFYAITQMASKGVVSMEELRRQLGQKLPGTMEIAAKAVGATVAELQKAISTGVVDSTKFLNLFGSELVRTFQGSAEIASTSVSAAINRLTNVWVDFVKSILDSGAGAAIISVFDTLRSKLSDTTLMQHFSGMVDELATKLQGFISKLTAEDIENGFIAFEHFVVALTTVLGGLITSLTWIIDHGAVAGAILGAIGGAAVGARIGGIPGAVAGMGIGSIAGEVAGRALQPDQNDVAQKSFNDLYAKQMQEQQKQQGEGYQQQLLQLLGQLQSKGLQLQDNGPISKLLDQDTATMKQVEDLTVILGNTYKKPGQLQQAVTDYANTGQVLAPRGTGIADVLGGPGKLTAQQKSENATLEKAFGLDSDYSQQLTNLNNLLHEGRLSLDQYGVALRALVEKQPVEIAQTKAMTAAQNLQNKEEDDWLVIILKQVDMKEKVQNQLSDETKLAGLRNDQLQVEAEVTKLVNDYKAQGLTVDEKTLQVWRQQIYAKDQLASAAKLADQMRGEGSEKYSSQYDFLKNKDSLVAKGNVTNGDVTDHFVNADPNMKGSNQWMDSQKKQLQQYYDFIDTLRSKDVIDDATAQQAKATAQAQYDQLRLSQVSDFFGTLAGLSNSSNKELSRIGKAAAIVDATIKGYQAIQFALAAPPGWPYNAANVAAVTILQASNVAAIAAQGFESGGYTGDGGMSDPAGIVHGQEFVVNAAATARNRAALEAMNRGGSHNGGINVSIVNTGTSKHFDVTQVTPSQVRIIARDEATKAVQTGAPMAVARDMQNANGAVSKALMRTTYTRRNR